MEIVPLSDTCPLCVKKKDYCIQVNVSTNLFARVQVHLSICFTIMRI